MRGMTIGFVRRPPLEAVVRPARRSVVPTGEEPGTRAYITPVPLPSTSLLSSQIAEGALLNVTHGDAITLTEVGFE